MLNLIYFGCYNLLGRDNTAFFSDKNGAKCMFYGEYPEYPETALIFDFNRSDYLKPDQQQQFFKMVNSKFGNATVLRSFTLFESAFHEISFWLDEKKVSTGLPFLNRIKPTKIDQMANNLAKNLSKTFDLEITARIVEINKSKSEQEE